MEKPADFSQETEYDKYSAYLQSKTWASIRTKRLLLDDFRCAICKSPTQLQVHHIFYPPEYGTEDMNDLITLCQECHGLIEHLKKYGSTTKKWPMCHFTMSSKVLATRNDIRKFLIEHKLPKGRIQTTFETPDGEWLADRRTNIAGIMFIRNEVGAENVSLRVDDY